MKHATRKLVILKPGKEKAISNRHHWIFSGAIESMPAYEDGEVLGVSSSTGKFLGSGYFNKKSKIIGRMLCFDEKNPKQAIATHIDNAIALRKELFSHGKTTAYRLINGEGDVLPGLIVDRYADILVIQIATLGMDRLRDWIVEQLVSKLKPQAIYEKSVQQTRKEEGLQERQGIIYGEKESVQAIPVIENDMKFEVDVSTGQKTGLFLDHRQMRDQIRQLAQGKRVLNCCAYTGGFTIAALVGGASRVDSVDISENVLATARHHVSINGFDPEQQGFYHEDLFDFLRKRTLDYEIVILDPPAFAKRQKDVVSACRGYKDINRMTMMKMPSRSLLLTCSCSYHVNPILFQQVVFQAATESGKNIRIIGRHRLAEDHPINIFHPEGDYLKSLLLYVE